MKKIIILLFYATITSTSEIITDVQIPIINSNVTKSPLADDNVRLVSIYLPAVVDLNDPFTRYPVIYYLHGLGGNNNSFDFDNQILMDFLLENNEAVPIIIVHIDASMLDGVDDRGLKEYLGTWYINSELNGNFEDFIVLDLIPYIDANYPTIAQPGFRAICGQSMGGYGAYYLGMVHPELFCGFGGESGTPFWSILTNVVPDVVDPGSINPPGDVMFVLNSLLIPEIPTSGPNAGRITPDNPSSVPPAISFSYTLYSWAAAQSPNVDNPPYYVDLPFEADANGTPVFTAGSFEIADPVTGVRTTINQSLTPRQDVIDRWKINNPFLRIEEFQETLKKQAIYIDGGDLELINAVGARVFSDKLSDFGINHEYILYHGFHTDCLTPEPCARNLTMFQMFSAKFAEAGVYSDDIRTKLTGTGTIVLDNTTMEITNGAMVGIETNPALGITETDITINIINGGALIIGSETNATPQGALQIGNNVTKALINRDPDLAANKVFATIIIDDADAQFTILPYGFFGIGAGVNGFAPLNVNQWGVSTLFNVEEVTINIPQGTFRHNIFSTPTEHVSLMAIGLSKLYHLTIDPDRAIILGGGSCIGLGDNYLSHPVMKAFVGIDFPGGVRNILNTNENAIDYFFQKLMGSNAFYLNNRNIGFEASSGQFDNQIEQGGNPFDINESIFESFYDKLAIDEHDTFKSLESKEATVTPVGIDKSLLAYIEENKEIIVIQQDNVPIGTCQQLDLRAIAEQYGYADIVIQNLRNARTLIRVDSPIAEA